METQNDDFNNINAELISSNEGNCSMITITAFIMFNYLIACRSTICFFRDVLFLFCISLTTFHQ